MVISLEIQVSVLIPAHVQDKLHNASGTVGSIKVTIKFYCLDGSRREVEEMVEVCSNSALAKTKVEGCGNVDLY